MTSSMPSYEVKPIAGTIGAEILGVDLTQDLSADAFNDIHETFLKYLVIFFPEQKELEPKHLKALKTLGFWMTSLLFFRSKYQLLKVIQKFITTLKRLITRVLTSVVSGMPMSPIVKNRIWPRSYTRKTCQKLAETRCSPISTWPSKPCPKN